MCGILGYVGGTTEQMNNAAETIAYRGPDYYGSFCDYTLCLGHQRLSIIDLDSRSNQPMADANEDLQIVFNGEIYNYKELKQNLLTHNFIFKTESDTEVILNAYKLSGTESIKTLQGMFAFGIYDKPNKKVIIARDHAGIKPLYYYHTDKVFAFASEIKALVSLLKQNNIQIELDKNALRQFVILGYIPNPNSLVKGIKKLPKCSYAEFDLTNHTLIINKYQPVYQKIETPEQFQDLLEKKVLSHLMADVPVGVYFSGGTDSGIIAAILHKHKVKLKTFSIDLGNGSDKYYFDKINDLLNLESQVFAFGKNEMRDSYRLVSQRIDEPSADSSIYPTSFISQMAAKDVKVVLSGEGGDEYFWGYHRHPILNRMTFKKEALTRPLFALARLLPLKSRRRFYIQMGKILKYPWLYYLASMSPSVEYLDYKSLLLVAKEVESQVHDPVYLDRDLYLENDLLRKIDLATSYSSIEGRVPLLDIDIVKNSELFKQKHLKNNELKSLLKLFLTSYLPNDLVYRNKSGFGLKNDAISDCPELIEDAKIGLNFLNQQRLLPKLNVNELMSGNTGLIYAAASLKSAMQNLGLNLK
jgi:asparagine synthase (glutamine-hydrolysing)